MEFDSINIYHDCIQYHKHTMRPYLCSAMYFESQEFIYLDHLQKNRSDPEDSRGQGFEDSSEIHNIFSKHNWSRTIYDVQYRIILNLPPLVEDPESRGYRISGACPPLEGC